MALEQRLNLKQTLQLRMTPQLRQAIKILQVSRAELETMVGDELCQNPALEENDTPGDGAELETRTGDVENSETETAVEAPTKDKDDDATDLKEVDWEEFLERNSSDFHGSIGTGSDRDDNKASFIENTAESGDDLVTAMLDQLNLVMMNEEEKRVATIVVHNLNHNGYLAGSREEVAALAECSVEFLDEVREIVQELEPRGVASVDLRECLLCQLTAIGYEEDDFVVQIVDKHLKELESKRFDKLARTLGTTVEEVVECQNIIQGLEPKPGRNFDDGSTRYVVPDVYIQRDGEGFIVILNDEGMPKLRVSPYYRDMIAAGMNSAEAKSYLQDKMRSALWLIHSIENRKKTLRKVTESIIRFQSDFLKNGVQHLKPMVLKDVAQDIDMHESTVSRATANKYVHTPQGIFELKYFFTSSIRGTDGTDVSSESVKQRIQQIIGTEDPKKPFSDQYISDALGKENIDIARRTVAKYRELLGILPSSKRKRFVA